MSNRISFEEYLRQHETLTYTQKGVSMLPLLREGRDLFTVRRKGPERCRPGDVVLYRRGRQYVLHRVIRVRPEDYVIQGDYRAGREYGIRDGEILGVMTGFIRDGKEHGTEELRCRVYTRVMLMTAGPRQLMIRLKGRLAGALKRGRHEK